MQEQNMNISRLPFEIWKSTLRLNCSLKGKLTAFDWLGEYVLSILWERGLNLRRMLSLKMQSTNFNHIAPQEAGCQRADVASLISPCWRCHRTVEQIKEVTRPPAFVAVLDVFPLGPPNGSIPLKNFLLAFQSKS
jgi:hypothetical protein